MDIEGLTLTPNSVGWRLDTRAVPEPRNSILLYNPDGWLPTDIYPPCCVRRINAYMLNANE
jgi:hypothetical protein